MKFKQIAAVALFLFFSMENFSEAKAQTVAARGSRHAVALAGQQPAQVLIIPDQLTDFERYASQADQPLVTVSFSAIAAAAPGALLRLTPLALAPFNAPNALKALAVEFHLSQSSSSASGAEVSKVHSVTTLLDSDELLGVRSLFHVLAVSGMPRSQFSDAKTLVQLVTKTGMRLEFMGQPGGRIQCSVTTEADSVVLSLDEESVTKWEEAFYSAWRTLDSAKDSIASH
jgi:hypothetical protein